MAETQNDPLVSSMSNFMYVFMPTQCSFVLNKNELAAHRIDPQLDQQLRAENNPPPQNVTETNSTIPHSNSTLLNGTALDGNATSIVGDMGNVDQIDLGEKWGFDIGMSPDDY
jgi:hypothetical protein